ncbi:MAG: hypothetical protein AB8F26_02985 [Phycisphaerales bacterium]
MSCRLERTTGISLYPRAGAILAVLVATGAAAHAELIRFEHAGVGSGTLRLDDGTGQVIAFTDANFVITAIGDTDAREELFVNPIDPSYGYAITHQSTTIQIDGVGSFVLNSETRTYAIRDVDGSGRIGLGRTRANGGFDLFNGPVMPDFSDWDMLSGIELDSPSGGRLIQWDAAPMETDGGSLVFQFNTATPWSFRATMVPTPAGVGLFGFGSLLVMRRRR